MKHIEFHRRQLCRQHVRHVGRIRAEQKLIQKRLALSERACEILRSTLPSY